MISRWLLPLFHDKGFFFSFNSGSGYYEETSASEVDSTVRRLYHGRTHLHRHRADEERKPARIPAELQRKATQATKPHRHVRSNRRRNGLLGIPGTLNILIMIFRPSFLNFLVADTQLYKRLCPSVRRSVRGHELKSEEMRVLEHF